MGIDMGLDYYASLSDGMHIENPRYYRNAQDVIARRDRAMRAKKTRSKTYQGKNRAKAAILLRKAHRHVTNQRKNMQHKAARHIVDTYGAIAVEALRIDNMSKRPAPIHQERRWDVRAERGGGADGIEQEYPGCQLGLLHLYSHP